MYAEKIYLFGTLLLAVVIIVLGIIFFGDTFEVYGSWVVTSILILNSPLLYMLLKNSRKP